MTTKTDEPQSADAAPAVVDKKRKNANADVAELEVDLTLPEPPSKRAKRLLKKGKVLPAKSRANLDDDDDKDDNDNDAAAKSTTTKGGKKKEERSQFGIWIGNLPFTVTRTQLFKWFVDNSGGAIAESDITRINLPLGKRLAHSSHNLRPNNIHADSQGQALPPNKGFAYVDFLTREAQVAATALSETEIDGRRVLIKDNKSFEGRPASAPQAGDDSEKTKTPRNKAGEPNEDPATAAPQGTTSTKVFVGNLGFDTSEDDLRRHFAPCGPIAWVKVATFPDNTEKCRGYGWVQFGGKTETDDGGQRNVAPEVAAEAAAAAVRGFVRLQETVDTEEDFVAEAEGVAADAEEEAAAAAKKKIRTRKWWVNQFKGRPLKVQFAEDDVSRYKKRFGKGRPRDDGDGKAKGGSGGSSAAPRREERENRFKPFKQRDIGVAALTGGIVESTGKKTVFE